jgi:endonuclease YncB( thermonuclease family)
MKLTISACAPALAAFYTLLNTATASDIVGTAPKVIDGDTLYVCDERFCEKIRICGINAPELKDEGGNHAKAALASIVADKQVRCLQVGHGTVCDGRSKPTSRDRIVAQCFIGRKDIAQQLVEQGHACDWRKFSGGYYSERGQGFVCP